MKIVVSYLKNEKAKVKAVGKTLSLLTLLVSISKCLTERISEEKKIGIKDAENFVIDCIKDSVKTMEN